MRAALAPAGILASVLVVGALLAGCLYGGQPVPEGGEPLRIDFLDVGQGDAALVRAPGGQTLLVDAGPNDRVVEHLERLGVERIDLFIASHNHADHIGGAAAVVRAFPVRFVMDNAIPHTTVTYRRWLEALAEADVPLLEPERRSIELGEARLEIVPPPGDPALGHNDNSVGVLLEYGEFRAFFGGDAEGPLWDWWVAEHPELLPPVQVHKASHHGSRAGDTAEGLARLRPRVVVVSAGRENQYGHPHAAALALYDGVGAEVRTTAEEGTITVLARSDGSFVIESARRPPPAPGIELLIEVLEFARLLVSRAGP